MIDNRMGAIFDLDGTLLDSMGVWRKIDEDFLGKRGFIVPDDYLVAITSKNFDAAAEYTKERLICRSPKKRLSKNGLIWRLNLIPMK